MRRMAGSHEKIVNGPVHPNVPNSDRGTYNCGRAANLRAAKTDLNSAPDFWREIGQQCCKSLG